MGCGGVGPGFLSNGLLVIPVHVVNAGHAQAGGERQSLFEQAAHFCRARFWQEFGNPVLGALAQLAGGFAVLVQHDLAVGTDDAPVENSGLF